VIIKFCLVFPKIFLLHKVVRDAKKVEKHCSSLHSGCLPTRLPHVNDFRHVNRTVHWRQNGLFRFGGPLL